MMTRAIPSSRPSRAFTIAEVLLSLAMLAAILLVISTLLFAVGEAASGEREQRARAQRRQVATERAASVFRAARRLLALDDTRAILWTSDADRDLAPRLSELCVVEWDGASGEVKVYRAPEGLADSSDTIYDAATNFLTATAAIMDTSVLPGALLLRDLTDWQVEPDESNVVDARVVTLRMAFVDEPIEERSIIAAAFRLP